MKTKICFFCKKEFQAKRKDAKYCSTSCRSRACLTRKAVERQVDFVSHQCDECGGNVLRDYNSFCRGKKKICLWCWAHGPGAGKSATGKIGFVPMKDKPGSGDLKPSRTRALTKSR